MSNFINFTIQNRDFYHDGSSTSTPFSIPYYPGSSSPTPIPMPTPHFLSLPSNLTPQYDSGNISWILCSTALVFLMIPGVGYFYSGMAKTKHALSLIMLSCWSIVIVYIQWFLFGYSLTFSRSANLIIGNFDHAFLMGVLNNPSIASEHIPDILFCIYQSMFAAITPALAIGAAAERGRFFPTIIFIFLWTTLVYDFIACWTWNPNGWSNKMGGLDYAGGTPVHISSGAAALAYAIILGHRTERIHKGMESKPHNMSNVVLGTVLIWFGWWGFNGGSALAANSRAILACVVTCLAASVGGIVWTLLDFRVEKKFSPIAFCSGVVAGLVTITPACGFVSPASSIVFGVVGAISCNFAMNLKHWLSFDDALDVFALHGVGGIVGNILTGIFAQKEIALLDGQVILGGWLDGNWIQVAYQLADSAAGLTWSFIVTYILLFCMNKFPGLSLRVELSLEATGLDQGELGVSCYEYVEEVRVPGSMLDMWIENKAAANGNGNSNPYPSAKNPTFQMASVHL